MTSLFRRAAICAVTACGFSALAQAQDSIVAPERAVLRRSLPVAAAPIVQQSPNGLYKLSITDTGIELLGPKGGVTITDTGIDIGAPTTTRVRIITTDMEVRSGGTVRLDAGSSMDIKAGSNLNLRSSAAVEVRGDGAASLTGSAVKLGCGPTTGKPAARVGDVVNTSTTPAMVVQGSSTVQVC